MSTLPNGMVQAALRRWDKRQEDRVEAPPNHHIKALLEAALSSCEVGEEYGVRWLDIETTNERKTSWYTDPDRAEQVFEEMDEVWGHHAQRVRRVIYVTQPEVCDAY